MSKEAHSLDIRTIPELARLASQVRASNRPLFLREAEETVAVLMPVAQPKRRARRERTEADHQAFLSSLGSWKGLVDVEEFKRDNAKSRQLSLRPRPDL